MSDAHILGSGDVHSPEWLIALAGGVLGGIDLDPASSESANERVGALRFYDRRSDGLTASWDYNRIYVNAPGSCLEKDGFWRCGDKLPNGSPRQACGCKLTGLFWRRAALAARHGFRVFWVGVNVMHLQTLQHTYSVTPLSYPTCILRDRIRFLSTGGIELRAPRYSNYISYLAPSEHWPRFYDACAKIGQTTLPLVTPR
jgi:hypothetical protein